MFFPKAIAQFKVQTFPKRIRPLIEPLLKNSSSFLFLFLFLSLSLSLLFSFSFYVTVFSLYLSLSLIALWKKNIIRCQLSPIDIFTYCKCGIVFFLGRSFLIPKIKEGIAIAWRGVHTNQDETWIDHCFNVLNPPWFRWKPWPTSSIQQLFESPIKQANVTALDRFCSAGPSSNHLLEKLSGKNQQSAFLPLLGPVFWLRRPSRPSK